MEFAKILVGTTAVIMYLTKTYYVKTSLRNLSTREGEFINFQRVAIWNEVFIYCVGFICFTSILYVINLLRFNVKMSALALVLKNSTDELMSFSVIFFILFFAFASFAYIGEYFDYINELTSLSELLAFGPTMLIYSGMVITLQTMFGHLLGNTDQAKLCFQDEFQETLTFQK